VHLEEAERCVDLYVSSMTTAGLLTADGDRVTHVANEDLAVTIAPAAATDPASAISPAKQRIKVIAGEILTSALGCRKVLIIRGLPSYQTTPHPRLCFT
jgi:hypothetical protein